MRILQVEKNKYPESDNPDYREISYCSYIIKQYGKIIGKCFFVHKEVYTSKI